MLERTPREKTSRQSASTKLFNESSLAPVSTFRRVRWPRCDLHNESETSIAMNRSFLCASIPTYVVICFMTGSYRLRLWRREALTRDLGGSHHLVECDSTTTLR